MNGFFKYAKIDKILRASLQISAILLFGQLVYTTFSYFSLPPLIPLFNQLPWGEERLGLRFEIFFPSILVIVLLFCNFFFVNRLYTRMPLVARILAITTLLISVLSCIFTIQTLSIIL